MTTDARIGSLAAIEREIGVMMRRVRRVVGERARTVHPSLHPASYLLLGYLVEHGPRRSSELVEVFDVDKGAVSRQVQQLVDLALVERTPDPDDGRAALVRATAEAVRRMAEVSRQRLVQLDHRLETWDDDRLSEFVEVLSGYNAMLSEPPAPAATPLSPQEAR